MVGGGLSQPTSVRPTLNMHALQVTNDKRRRSTAEVVMMEVALKKQKKRWSSAAVLQVAVVWRVSVETAFAGNPS